MPPTRKPYGRFELPQLTPVNFSLTDGTNIPPPPVSPVEEQAPPQAPKPNPAKSVTAPLNGGIVSSTTNGSVRATDDHPPASPMSTTRPNSIRRFLSRDKSLNLSYMNGMNNAASRDDPAGPGRPDSPSSAMTGSRKRRGSWFRRLGGSGTENQTSLMHEAPPAKKPMGPPPPKLPELNQLKARIPEEDEGALGGEDLFKNIK